MGGGQLQWASPSGSALGSDQLWNATPEPQQHTLQLPPVWQNFLFPMEALHANQPNAGPQQ